MRRFQWHDAAPTELQHYHSNFYKDFSPDGLIENLSTVFPQRRRRDIFVDPKQNYPKLRRSGMMKSLPLMLPFRCCHRDYWHIFCFQKIRYGIDSTDRFRNSPRTPCGAARQHAWGKPSIVHGRNDAARRQLFRPVVLSSERCNISGHIHLLHDPGQLSCRRTHSWRRREFLWDYFCRWRIRSWQHIQSHAERNFDHPGLFPKRSRFYRTLWRTPAWDDGPG